MSPARPLAVLAAISALLSGCVPTFLSTGANVGVAAAEERGLSGSVDDFKIRTEISRLWLDRNAEMFSKGTLNLSEGRVMVTGVMPTAQMRDDAIKLTWQVAGVREVYNHLVVRPPGQDGNSSMANDAWILQKLKARLLGDVDVTSINYELDVTDAVVYILGIAQNQAELNRVVSHARDVSGVRQVVHHIILKTDPRRVGR